MAEFAAGTVAVAAIGVIPVGVGALGRTAKSPTEPSTSGSSTSGQSLGRPFVSRHYGYTEALPAGWSSVAPATQRWDGKGAPADLSSVVDLFTGPHGVEAWAYAAPTKKNLAAYTTATIRAARAGHPCSAPQTSQAITIDGVPARLLGMQCLPRSGFLVEIAVTVRHGTAYVFASQNPGRTQPTDRAAFRKFLVYLRLQR